MSRFRPLLLTIFLVSPVLCAAQSTSPDDDLRSNLKSLTSIYTILQTNFADPVDGDRLIYHGAIPGMLHTLDPHSNFLDRKAYETLREDQEGHYFGVGMMVGAPNGHVSVMYPIPGSPAFRAGLRPGDVIVGVDDRKIDREGTAEVATLLRGPRGTRVQISVRREGTPNQLSFVVTRDAVPQSSIRPTFWLRPGVAYLGIESFNENTAKEVEDSLHKLGEESIDALILDLRDNPGGLLTAGVSVAERFLKKGQVIVTHHGRKSAESRFVAKRDDGGRDYPIVVLVNRNSASAAEIVSGALQDHDRAWIVGEPTFGKGLVQSQYPLSDDCALLLTIAKYYTPSGRLIQRDYSHHSLLEYYSRMDRASNPQDTKRTDSGRIVYGGDGIKPDESYTPPLLSDFEARLLRNYAFFNFSSKYFVTHPRKLPAGWNPGDEVMNDFRAFLQAAHVTFTGDEFNRERTWIGQQLKIEFFLTAFDKDASDRVAIAADPAVVKGIESLPASRTLLTRAKLAQRTENKPTVAR
ncbi:MAG TPA: S41 family peptidase [Bryobacteraceae bacterium]|nr:S41 family peptidase [Bryobacteraceae bacterium]